MSSNKNYSTIIAAMALLVSVVGAIYQQHQTSLLADQSELSVHSMLIERNAELLKMLVEYPEVRPMFYDNAPLAESDSIAVSRARTMAEMWTDLFEQVMIQLENLPEEMSSTWEQYAIDMHSSSPAIREYFAESCDWYVVSLQELWGCEQ